MRASVLINNFNNARYLRDCVDSVLGSAGAAAEVVVYDDGSTDGSQEILRSYGSRIILLCGEHDSRRPAQVNQGRAIETAFARSTGEVICLLDGDDTFKPHKLAHYLAAFASTPAPVMVQAPLQVIDRQGQAVSRVSEPFRHEADPLDAVYVRNDPDVFYPTSALAFHRRFLEQWLPLDWSDGAASWMDVRLGCAALLSGRVVTLPEQCGQWRWHEQSFYTSKAGARTFLIRQTWQRVRQFNHYCRMMNRPTISIWRNRRFHRQLLGLFPGGRRVARWFAPARPVGSEMAAGGGEHG
jgi:glycosyltransferase involved in cell wall biosynthesis